MLSCVVVWSCGEPDWEHTRSSPDATPRSDNPVEIPALGAAPLEPPRSVRASELELEHVPRSGPLPEFEGLDEVVRRVTPDMIAKRRTIHQHPELGEREIETSKLVKAHLEALGLEVRSGIAKTGVVATLRGQLPGNVVAWRADMDALPITEATSLPFASTRKDMWEGKQVGVMHACGHDLHTAIALGLASVLSDPAIKQQLRGSMLFVFQPAEEGVFEPGDHGAKLMMKEHVFEPLRPSAIMGLHVSPQLDVGEVGLVPGGALAAADRLEITVYGKQTHGAYPHEGVDPVLVSSHVIVALQAIAARNVDTRQTVVVSVGQIESGNRHNIIPETAHLVGTIRTHDEHVQTYVHRRVHEIATGVAAALGAKATVTIEKLTPVTYNDKPLMARMRPVFERVFGKAGVVAELPHMGGEDFAFYAREVPGLFYFLGVANAGKNMNSMTHTPTFMADEDALEIGLRSASQLVLTYLHDRAQAN